MARRQALKRFLIAIGVMLMVVVLVATGLYFVNDGIMRLTIWQNPEKAHQIFEKSIAEFNDQTTFDIVINTRLNSQLRRFSTLTQAKIVKNGENDYSYHAVITTINTHDLLNSENVGTFKKTLIYDNGMLYVSQQSNKTKHAFGWQDAINELVGAEHSMQNLGISPVQIQSQTQQQYETQVTSFNYSFVPFFVGVSKKLTTEEGVTYRHNETSVSMFGNVKGQHVAYYSVLENTVDEYTLGIGYYKTKNFTRVDLVPENLSTNPDYVLLA